MSPQYTSLPLLAICRVGHVNAQIRSEIKKRFLEGDEPALRKDDPLWGGALVLALLKLGEREFLKNIESLQQRN
jgi:hypothetical protein